VTGVSARGIISTVNVWGVIDTAQTANWTPVADSQSGAWSSINDAQTPGWAQTG
jgi:hypothetical protein